jgi:hypothetical protein
MATDPTADDDFRPNQPSRFFCTSSDLHDLGENELKFGSRNEEGQTKTVCGVRSRSPAIWNAGARRKTGGIHHHLLSVRPRAGRPCHPHERDARGYQWRHRQLKPSFPFRMDTPRIGNHLHVLRHPTGERTVEFAMAAGAAARRLPHNPRLWDQACNRYATSGPRRHLDVSMTHRFLR